MLRDEIPCVAAAACVQTTQTYWDDRRECQCSESELPFLLRPCGFVMYT